MRTTTSILEAQPFLRGMALPQLELMAQDSMLSEFKTGELILHQGSPANRFYLVLEGHVDIEAPLSDGGVACIETLGAGDALGWSWMFPPYYWHFDARAKMPTRAIFFYGTHLRELCEENHDLGYELMKRVADILIKRLQATRRQLLDQNQNLVFPI